MRNHKEPMVLERIRAHATEKGLSFIQRYEELSKFGLGLHE